MGKLEPFDNKRTKWQGLWYTPKNYTFTSAVLSLSDLRKFKGNKNMEEHKNEV